MPYFPTVTETPATQVVTEAFRGYNHNLKIGDGEFYDMQNLTSSFYPLLVNRKKRGIVAALTDPQGMTGKAELAYIANGRLFYGGDDITGNFPADVVISGGEKTLVSMGAYIIIYPDKLYINTENYSDCGRIEAHFSGVEGASVTYTLCKADGSDYEGQTVSPTEPEEPSNGDLWIDTSEEIHVLKQYNASTAVWTTIPTSYVRISYPGIGMQFAVCDGVTISGVQGEGGAESQLNGSKIVYESGDNFLVVVGIIDRTYTQSAGAVSVSRTMPDMDFITEAENRLWGCKYGLVNGRTVNEVYACALGDFKNWNQFLGVSTDSYAASVGTDGEWTGAVTHLGYPLFFKENVLHKVYISASGAHKIADTACRGAQKGCGKSLVVVGDTLFYKSRDGVCAYDGSLPIPVGDAMGEVRYSDAVAGAFGDKYYVSMRDGGDAWHLFVFDTVKGYWHREDATHALCFARCGDELYFIEADSGELVAINGTVGTPETAVRWEAVTGLMGYDYVEKKYIGRINLRMKLPENSKADLFMEYDSSGIWEFSGHMDGVGTKTFMLPVRPRRCDHFRFKLSGEGDVRVYSLARIVEKGSDE